MNWEVRKYQQEAVEACLAGFTSHGKTSVMLESPVGSGKTFMALETIHALQERLGRKLKVNWVAPRRHLLCQVMEVNRELHGDNIRPVSLFERMPPEADFVVLDEAHHEATQSCILLYEKMNGQFTLGLSATPLRTDRMKLSFQETVTTCSIDRLIREGFLSSFHSYLLPHYGPQIAAECYLSAPGKWGKTLAFFKTVLECVQFQEALARAGARCEVVTAESDKDWQLEEFVADKVRVIANVAMLSEGFDQPDVQTIFARDASRLPTIQMCGRGLRRAAGKSFCNIVQGAGTAYLFDRVSPPHKSFRLMNGQWMALQDGTEAIESTLKASLALLEQREQNRKNHQQVGGRRTSSPRRFAPAPALLPGETPHARQTFDSVELPPFYETYKGAYRALYDCYAICNRLCWNGALPPVALVMERNRKPTHVAGLATMAKVCVNGVPYHEIKLTLTICRHLGMDGLLAVLMHEMTHIWQYATGRHGGHGADFRKEMLRIGIDEKARPTHIRIGSPADKAISTIKACTPDFISSLSTIYNDADLVQPRNGDHAFFRLMIESGALSAESYPDPIIP